MTTNAELRKVLPSIPIGRSVFAYGRNVKHMADLCKSVRRGTEKYFTCKTTELGVLIQRVE